MFELGDFYNLKVFLKSLSSIVLYYLFALIFLYYSDMDPVIATALSNGVFIIGYIFYSLYKNGFSIKRKDNDKDLKTEKYLIIFIILFFIGFILSQALSLNLLNNNIGVSESDKTFKTSVSPYFYIIFLLFIAPIGEEIIFRRCFFDKLLTWRYPVLLAMVVQAFIFSIAHGSGYKIIATFFVGFCAGFIYYKYKKVIYNMVFHILNNVFVMMLSNNIFIKKLSKNSTMVLSLFCIIFIIVFSYYIQKRIISIRDEEVKIINHS